MIQLTKSEKRYFRRDFPTWAQLCDQLLQKTNYRRFWFYQVCHCFGKDGPSILIRIIMSRCFWKKTNKKSIDKTIKLQMLLLLNLKGDFLHIKWGNSNYVGKCQSYKNGRRLNRLKIHILRLCLKLCSKARQKLHALAQTSSNISKVKLKIVVNEFFTAICSGYCPSVAMFHNRTWNNKIKLQERSLRLVYNGSTFSFTEFLEKDQRGIFTTDSSPPKYPKTYSWTLELLKLSFTKPQK